MKNSMILSVSVNKTDAEFLDEAELSPSQLIQEAIAARKLIWEAHKSDRAHLLAKIEALSAYLSSATGFLNQIGKYDDFEKWRNENVGQKN